jgi:hypothetical protein
MNTSSRFLELKTSENVTDFVCSTTHKHTHTNRQMESTRYQAPDALTEAECEY